jgi:hypothetical protein
MKQLAKVVKIDVTWPFCVRRHVHVYPYASVAFVKTDTRKKFITLKLPPLCAAIKKGFGHHTIGD